MIKLTGINDLFTFLDSKEVKWTIDQKSKAARCIVEGTYMPPTHATAYILTGKYPAFSSRKEASEIIGVPGIDLGILDMIAVFVNRDDWVSMFASREPHRNILKEVVKRLRLQGIHHSFWGLTDE
jgi:hypothetical protein